VNKLSQATERMHTHRLIIKRKTPELGIGKIFKHTIIQKLKIQGLLLTVDPKEGDYLPLLVKMFLPRDLLLNNL